jgi:hypothetical protein
MQYILADLHGCGEELIALLAQIKFDPAHDQLYLVGDCFDRGPTPQLVWQIIHQYHATVNLGNHEVKMLSYLRGQRDYVPAHYHYALHTLTAHGIKWEKVANFIEGLPLLVHLNDSAVIVTHGGVALHNPFAPNVDANVYGHCVWNKRPPNRGGNFWWDKYTREKPFIVYGHLVSEDDTARRRKNSIGIDTGVVHGHSLTAYCVETDEVHQYASGINHFALLKRGFKNKPPPPFIT